MRAANPVNYTQIDDDALQLLGSIDRLPLDKNAALLDVGCIPDTLATVSAKKRIKLTPIVEWRSFLTFALLAARRRSSRPSRTAWLRWRSRSST